MKTKSLYFAALLVIGAAVSAVAKEEPTNAGMAVVSVKGSEVVKVIYKGETAGKVKVNIYNAASQIVFSESRNNTANGFILPLNFSGLEFGAYTVEIVDANGAKSEKISYQPATTTSNVHVTKLNDGKFLLSVAKQGAEDITVKVFDNYNNLVHTSNKQVAGDFAQVFSIKNFSGSCTFEISSAEGQTTIVRF